MNHSPTLAGPSAAADAAGLTSGQRARMLAMLTIVSTCSLMDKAIIGTLLEPIKNEFRLPDLQMGVIAGLAFALAHAVVAIPFGRLADRVNRRNLIAACLLAWSAMTAFCGLAQTFPQLLLARMGVGAGEAGGQSACLSAVSDLYPEKQRATAISIFYLSSPIGGMLAGSIGGLVAAAYGWRAALLVASAPGFLMTVVLLLLGREPPREKIAARDAGGERPSFAEVLRFIRAQRALLHLFAGLGLVTFTITGLGAFAASFFIRYHGMSLKQIGPTLGVAGGVIGVAMMLGSGLVADGLGRRDPRWRLWIVSLTLLAATPFLLAAYTVSGPAALPLYMTNLLVVNVWMGPGFATSQSLTPPRMRGTVAAIMFVVNGLLGYGFGPVIVGGLSDALAVHLGKESLRWALIMVAGLNVWAALHFYLASRTLRADLARLQGVGA
ncbi:MFS transporter [Phenylobacterium sp.]|uniref:spinster family MFS transporter n=1 Tax=Phenylobacterium sp. TaxID=1871053 RepID=UPI002F3FEC07